MIAKILNFIGFFDKKLSNQDKNKTDHTIKIYKKVEHEKELSYKWIEYDTGNIFLPKGKRFKL